MSRSHCATHYKLLAWWAFSAAGQPPFGQRPPLGRPWDAVSYPSCWEIPSAFPLFLVEWYLELVFTTVLAFYLLGALS